MVFFTNLQRFYLLDKTKTFVCLSFPFDFEDGMWDLVVLIPDHFLSVYFGFGDLGSIFKVTGEFSLKMSPVS